MCAVIIGEALATLGVPAAAGRVTRRPANHSRSATGRADRAGAEMLPPTAPILQAAAGVIYKRAASDSTGTFDSSSHWEGESGKPDYHDTIRIIQFGRGQLSPSSGVTCAEILNGVLFLSQTSICSLYLSRLSWS